MGAGAGDVQAASAACLDVLRSDRRDAHATRAQPGRRLRDSIEEDQSIRLLRTLIGGMEELRSSQMYPIAVLVGFASTLVPRTRLSYVIVWAGR